MEFPHSTIWIPIATLAVILVGLVRGIWFAAREYKHDPQKVHR